MSPRACNDLPLKSPDAGYRSRAGLRPGRERAYTLTEVVVASFMAVLVLGTILELFAYFRKTAEAPIASMDAEQATLAAIRWLQRDLAETNLQSIRSQSAAGQVAFESPRDAIDHLCLSDVGTVQWKKFVYYRLQPFPGHPGRYQLLYDESTSGVGVEPSAPPAAPSGASTRSRVLGTWFASPADGGLKVTWADSGGTQHDFGDSAAQRGEPVTVSFVLQTTSDATGKQTQRSVLFHARPQD